MKNYYLDINKEKPDGFVNGRKSNVKLPGGGQVMSPHSVTS
jgi:hypothetical protein